MNNVKSLSHLWKECLERDNFQCQDCGSTTDLCVHHKLPLSQGGLNVLDNLKTLCRNCHLNNYYDVHHPSDKSKIIPIQFREERGYRDLVNRKRISSMLGEKLSKEFNDLHKETRIPKSRLLDEAIELLLQKYKKLPTDK